MKYRLRNIVGGFIIFSIIFSSLVFWVDTGNANAASAPCSGYQLVRSKKISDVGKIKVYQKRIKNKFVMCVVNTATVKTSGKTVTRKVSLKWGSTTKKDSGKYKYYAGPLKYTAGGVVDGKSWAKFVKVSGSVTYEGKTYVSNFEFSPEM